MEIGYQVYERRFMADKLTVIPKNNFIMSFSSCYHLRSSGKIIKVVRFGSIMSMNTV